MQEAVQQIQVYDRTGAQIGVKSRGDIDRMNDIFHCVKVLVQTGAERFALSVIPDFAPSNNLHIGTLTATAATMLRVDEASEQAAQRALLREVGVQTNALRRIGTGQYSVDGITRLYSLFFAKSDGPFDRFDPTDIARIEFFSSGQIQKKLREESNAFDPAFALLWKRHLSQT